MRTIRGTLFRRSIQCGFIMASLAACGRSDSLPGTDTAATSPAAASEQRAATAAGTVASDARLAVADKPAVGSYLTDDKGRSVYLFMKDSGGTSSCYDACAAAWPPLIVGSRPVSSDSAVRTELLGTAQRRDGTMQATYKDVPLYYYEDDKQPGDIAGQDKLEFGGRWYLVSPAGGKQEGTKAAKKARGT